VNNEKSSADTRLNSKQLQQFLSPAEECAKYRAVLRKMLRIADDHMTACNRVMGASHPCTCGAREARALLNGQDPDNLPGSPQNYWVAEHEYVQNAAFSAPEQRDPTDPCAVCGAAFNRPTKRSN
jgi:hypothetical protein